MNCSICVEKINNPHKLICNHSFCKTCIFKWFNISKTCPLCRKSIQVDLPNNNNQNKNNSRYDENGNLRNRRQNYLDLYHEGNLEYEDRIPFTLY